MKTEEIIECLRHCVNGMCCDCRIADENGCTKELFLAAAERLGKCDVAINNQKHEIDALKKHVAELKKDLAERESAPGWISVEDELPKESGKLYWVYRKCKKISLSCYYSETNGWGFNDVAYWMPFPGFPKPKVKTYTDVYQDRMKEAFPEAVLGWSVTGKCRDKLFGINKPCTYQCRDCWNQPYPEKEGGEK